MGKASLESRRNRSRVEAARRATCGGSWGVLELPSLTFIEGSDIQAAKVRAIANGAA